MPQDSLVWIVLIVAAALVIGLAVWKGRHLRLNRGQEGFSIEVEHSPDTPATSEKSGESGQISVAKGAQIEQTRVGDIAGIKTAGKPQSTGHDIEVAAGTRIKNANVGDIVGMKEVGRRSEDEQ